MMYGPDCSSSDEEGLSDDNDYYEFKKRMKNRQQTINCNQIDNEVVEKKKRIQFVCSAISFGKYEALVSELDRGLDINDELEYGWTPLLLAATVANEKIISELLKRGADVNQTRDDSTALMLTCNIAAEDEDMKSNVLACCKLLLDNGIDPNTINRKRRTALMSAAYNGHLEVVKLLLPLTNKDAEDNQRWNALFWAAEGNKTEIVDLLLKEGFSCDKIDVRGNTIADVARSNGFENILKLLPKDPFNDEFYVCLNNNHVNFEEVFNNLKRQEKPQLFVDICKILYGTRSENMVSVLRDKDIDLLEFLSCSDSKLKEMGIQLPYQRNRILGGLFKFHKHPFQPKSIPFVRKGELYTNIDVSSAVLSCVRQLIAMEASLKFIMENHEVPLSPQESREIQASLAKNRSQIHRLKIVSEVFVKKTEKWDSTLKPADKITKKRWNIPWSNLCFSLGVISVAIILFKIK